MLGQMTVTANDEPMEVWCMSLHARLIDLGQLQSRFARIPN